MYRLRVANRLAGATPELVQAAACVYTVTPDRGFIIDRHPEMERVRVVSACSGHGFKHSAGIGEATDDPEVNGAFNLFAAVIAEAKKREGIDKRDTYHCGRIAEKRVDDPHYTLRGWRAVMTYLLRQPEFLYE